MRLALKGGQEQQCPLLARKGKWLLLERGVHGKHLGTTSGLKKKSLTWNQQQETAPLPYRHGKTGLANRAEANGSLHGPIPLFQNNSL